MVGWQERKVSWAFDIIGSGTTPNTADGTFYDGEIPWVNTGDLNDGVIQEIGKTVTALALATYSPLRIYDAGSLVIALYGATIGKLGILGWPACVNQACCVMSRPRVLSMRFAFYWFLANRPNILELAKGGGQPNIGQDTIRQLRILCPQVEVQKSIADFLDRRTAAIDGLIEKKRRLVELLAEKRAALINQAVTKGLDPSVPMKDSGVPWIGNIPVHWQVKRLKYTCRLETGHTPSRTDPECWIEEECVIPWVSLNDTKQLKVFDEIGDTYYKISKTGMARSSAHLIEPGAVVFTRDATIGLAAITTRAVAVSQHIIAWVCGPNVLNRYLLRVVDTMEPELDSLTFGATLKTIGMADIKQLTTPVPPLSEQFEIVAKLSTDLQRHNSTVQALEAQVTRLQEYRQALITAAVTGQLEIPALEKTADG